MTIADWRRTVYALLAFPALLASAATQRKLSKRLLGVSGTSGVSGTGGVSGTSRPRRLAALVPGFAAFLLSVLVWYLVGRIATYGLSWDPDPIHANASWGGPSLPGAWLVHFFTALGMCAICWTALRPLTGLQSRLLSPVGPGAPSRKTVAHS